MTTSAIACVGLGGNVGDAVATIRDALEALCALPGTRVLQASQLYRTPAWGREDQPAFVNAAARLETGLNPRDLLDALLALEREFGRERVDGERWGPRTLDLDLLLHGDTAIDEPGLRLPHPHLHERAFVLVPLMDVAPDAIIPGHGRVRDVRAAVTTDGIVALP